jgi:nitrite reductase/ring-hydroxylating ferredoxin subunit
MIRESNSIDDDDLATLSRARMDPTRSKSIKALTRKLLTALAQPVQSDAAVGGLRADPRSHNGPPAMDLPASVTDLGEQLRGDGEIVPASALFSDPQVFAAERERIFQRSVMALDHETRLSEDGRWFRCDAAARSIVVTREAGGRLNALRNVCIHAGYPVCEAEEGSAERLMCLYHGWEYALDGRLVEPELSSRIDPARLRLASYSVRVCNGLIFADPPGATAVEVNFVPAWLTAATVMRRARYNTNWNWKYLRHFLQSSPHLFFDGLPDDCQELGPLDLLFAQSRRAVLLRVIPKFAEQTDFQVIEMMAGENRRSPEPDTGSDPLAERLGAAGTSFSWFDRNIAQWYWSLMSEEV